MFHDRPWDIQLIATGLMEVHDHRELSGPFFPLGHTTSVPYPRIYGCLSMSIIHMDTKGSYIHVDMPYTMTAAWTDQRTPALAIVARGDQIQEVAPTEYVVRSQSRPDASYRVRVLRERWECECGFFGETKQACIHILAVRYREGFKSSPVAAPPTNPACERCKSGDVILSGKRRNKSGAVARYLCKACGFRFTGRDGFQRRRSDPEKIALALDLYFRGMSVRKVADHLAQVYSLKVSPATVYNWIAYFGKLAAEWMDRQGAKVGERWHVDETVVNVNGDHAYVWNVMDAETRFLLATHVSKNRSLEISPRARTRFFPALLRFIAKVGASPPSL